MRCIGAFYVADHGKEGGSFVIVNRHFNAFGIQEKRTRERRVGRCREDEGKQEAHGPRFAHLSDIATADMQMLCNIFPILSSQLMKISSFEQFLVLKKNIWA